MNFADVIRQTGDTYAFSVETAPHAVMGLVGAVKEMGLDPKVPKDFKTGIMRLFNVETVNMPDLSSGRYILAPNHVSDFDAVILGLLHPRIRIVSKTDWTQHPKLTEFLGIHYDLYGIDRASAESLHRLMKDAVQYFKEDDVNKHFMVFSQGTISDFNNNAPERVARIAQVLSAQANVQIVNVFVEQPSIEHPTRIVFDEPMTIGKKDDFRSIWLSRMAALQATLQPAARRPKLTHKHANNNKPGDEFF